MTDQSDPWGNSSPDIAPVPHRVHELGVPGSLLDDLILRRALLDGSTSTLRLAERLAVAPMLMEEALEGLRHRRLFDLEGHEGRNWLLRLTDEGHVRASERLELCRYAGPTPVGLAAYTEIVQSQRASPDVDRERDGAVHLRPRRKPDGAECAHDRPDRPPLLHPGPARVHRRGLPG